MSSNSRLQPVTNTKGRDLPVWLLWVNIDYTAASQLSGTTGAEDSHVLWFFFLGSNMWPNPRIGPALGPAGALLSAVHISMRVSAPRSGFSGLLLGAVRPPQQSVCRGSWNSLCSGYLGALTGWLPTWCGRIWVCAFPTPTFIHVIRLAMPDSLKALCWLPLLTSETWPAPWRWALTTEQEPCHRISKTLLWSTHRCQNSRCYLYCGFGYEIHSFGSKQWCLTRRCQRNCSPNIT